MAKVELHSDLIEDMDKTGKKGNLARKIPFKRIRKSIGWTEPIGGGWDVVTGDGEGMEVESQTKAEMLSILVQIHERLKRVEKKVLNEEE